ncbi:LOW QUALITY PROTEIN: DNA primase small subunit-like [Liolophura sinensis]|uniref:LOW QUALITY PROTEIN: DNA primase small subunit-like n=1 Tax=Liolophura sinensis TaxID=3198878 RepID=UPI003158D736
MEEYDPASLPDLLPIYYKRLFPYGPYFRWLSYGGIQKNYFTNREFSFTLKDDVYIRYQSFSDQQELEKEVQKRCPYKIDIGAVFTHKPKEHKTVKAAAFQAQEKELVFDIDMTDYDEVRFCCSGADICPQCWPLMVIALKIVDRALREDFGYEHLLWVYSGRRGIHCWVCDESARKLSQNARTAIAEYLSVVKGGENQTKKVNLGEFIHPSVERSLDIIQNYFKSYCLDKQDLLGDEDKWSKVLALITDEKLRSNVESDISKLGNNSLEKWELLKGIVNNAVSSNTAGKCKRVVEEIQLQFCYPRLDVNVSKGVNHLLKSPFCIHPKTGRVCVPIDHQNVDKFDPFKAPTVSQICEELNQVETTTNEDGKKIRDYKKTSLSGCMETFNKFVKNMEKTWKGKLIEQSDLKKEF